MVRQKKTHASARRSKRRNRLILISNVSLEKFSAHTRTTFNNHVFDLQILRPPPLDKFLRTQQCRGTHFSNVCNRGSQM